MRRIFSEPIQSCRSGSDRTGVGGVVQLLKLSKFGSPRTRCVYDWGFDADFVDADHFDKGEANLDAELAVAERYFI